MLRRLCSIESILLDGIEIWEKLKKIPSLRCVET